MMIDKDRIARAKAVPIQKVAASLGIDVGKDNKASCCFHAENTPSLSLDPPPKNLFHCFGCGIGGDTIRLVKLVKKCTFGEAVELILGGETSRCPPAPHQAMPRAVNASGVDYADVYEFLIQLLPYPNANHYLIAERDINPQVVEANSIRAVDPEQSWHYRDKLIAAFPEERLISSGVLAPNREKCGTHFFFWECCATVPFYTGGQIVYLQGLMRPDLRESHGKTRNLPGIKPTSIYVPVMTNSPSIYLTEGVISALYCANFGDNSIAILSASSVNEALAQELLPYKSHRFTLVPDVDSAGRKACEQLANLLFKGGFDYDPTILSAKDMARVLGATEEEVEGVKDVNDLRSILKRFRGWQAT